MALVMWLFERVDVEEEKEVSISEAKHGLQWRTH